MPPPGLEKFELCQILNAGTAERFDEKASQQSHYSKHVFLQL